MKRFQNQMARLKGRMESRAGFTLIELLVVMGIAALLMTLAATSFFGASRRDNIKKSRDQLCDVMRLGRQQASISGKTHVLVCWNAATKVTVGNKTVTGGEQGRYALFETVGNVWPKGAQLMAPFGIQREAFAALTKSARLINMNDPDKAEFMRIKDIRGDATQSDEENERDEENVQNVTVEYFVGGESKTFTMRDDNLWIATLRKSSGETKAFPLGIRTTQTYALPKDYAFTPKRAVFIFTPDGRIESGSDSSVTAKHSMSKNADNATFTVSIDANGEISKK